MVEIRKLEDIDFSKNTNIFFQATILDIISEGDGDKKPLIVTIKLEESGENYQCTSWKYDNLDIYRDGVKNDIVYKIEALAGTFGNYGAQIRLGNIVATESHSNKKVLKGIDINIIKREISNIVSQYVSNESDYMVLLNKLIFTNDKFWTWPAAKSVHHNYSGGLAQHSLNVCKHAIESWKIYAGENMSIELIVVGALLHDIGKLSEYNQDGSRTIYGNFIPHPVSGCEMITDVCYKNNIDANSKEILFLKHIILSHHDKLEYGASTRPYILEAFIVANADATDAEIEAGLRAVANLEKNNATDKGLTALDGAKIFKWK